MKLKKLLFVVILASMTLLTMVGCSSTPTQQAPATTEQQLAPAEQPPAPAEQQPAPTQQPPAPTPQPPAPAEQPPAPTPQPPVPNINTGSVIAIITSTSGLHIDDGDSSFSGTIVVKVSNDTGEDVEDIGLSLAIEADEEIPDVTKATLTGGGITWTFDDQDDNVLYFSNHSGLDVDEGDYEKMTLTLKVYFDDEVDEDTAFEASVEISDYGS